MNSRINVVCLLWTSYASSSSQSQSQHILQYSPAVNCQLHPVVPRVFPWAVSADELLSCHRYVKQFWVVFTFRFIRNLLKFEIFKRHFHLTNRNIYKLCVHILILVQFPIWGKMAHEEYLWGCCILQILKRSAFGWNADFNCDAV